MLWLAICGAMVLLLCAVSLRLSPAGQSRLRIGIGLSVLACEILKDAALLLQGVFSIYFLPLHLCGLAVFLVLAHSIRPSPVLGNLLYSTCMPGALFAILFPDWTAYPAFSFHSLVGFTVHALLTAYPLTQVLCGEIRVDARLLPRCFLLLLGMAVPVYALDRAIGANYMFLLWPAPGSPLEWFASWMGVPAYVLGYLPMLCCLWLLLYLPFSLFRRRKRTPNTE